MTGRGYTPHGILSEAVTGRGMLRALRALGARVEKSAHSLAVSWSADEILKSEAATKAPACNCVGVPASINVHPETAYALAAKSPQRTAAEAGVTGLAANHGGKVPLHSLGKILGPWDSLLEELIPRRRG